MERHESHPVQFLEDDAERWAFVEYGNRRFLGRLNGTRDELLRGDIEVLVMVPAYEFLILDIPAQDPRNSQSVGISRAGGLPMHYALNAHPSEIIFLNPGPIAFLSSMHQDDRQLYHSLLRQAEARATAQRAARIGIVPPGAGVPAAR